MKADDLRSEIIAQTEKWEQAEWHSPAEHKTAEAATRAFAELDALMREGREPPPAEWMPSAAGLSGTYVVVQTADIVLMSKNILAMKNKPGVTEAYKRLIDAADEARARA
jgi:hypothetical protein